MTLRELINSVDSEQYSESAFWDDFDNLQKAKMIR